MLMNVFLTEMLKIKESNLKLTYSYISCSAFELFSTIRIRRERDK